MELTMIKENKTGFTLVEVLMALVILGILMTAVAVAFDASVKNYQANEGIYRTANAGRQTLLRITNDVRTAQYIANVGVGPGQDSPGELTLVTGDGNNITYRFDSTQKTLRLYTATDDYLLCRNVAAMSFVRVPATTQPVRSVRISMELSDPDSAAVQKLVAAAVVRRNLDD
jgi:prepilin-type N-terminal cleavage/methylation domain-containing protein